MVNNSQSSLYTQVHFLSLLLKRRVEKKSSSSEVTIKSDKELSNEQTENTTLWGNCAWQVLEAIFQAKSYELPHQNADPEPLSGVYLHHQLQDKILKEKSQPHFFDCQNECKELTLHF